MKHYVERSPAEIAKRLRALAGRLERLMFAGDIDKALANALAQELRDEADRLEKL